MSASERSTGRWVIWGVVVFLGLIHWDFWLWDDRSLLFGFLPIGLAYHGLFSIAAAVTWALVIRLAWPEHLERWAGEGEDPTEAETRARP